jgi:redox-sensitive bicupin YhaK (pirin superfamily)
MTAGSGIAHAELSPDPHGDFLHGVQLWTALPSRHAGTNAAFAHHADLPVIDSPGATTTVFMGSLDEAESPARAFSPIVGAEITLDAESSVRLPLRKDFEYALLVVSGTVEIGLLSLEQGPLLYLGRGRDEIRLMAQGPSRALLLGGEPFDEQIVMWWNFIGRDHDEIVQFRQNWEAGVRFGAVTGGYQGGTLPAPPMPATRLKPRGRTR